MATKATTKNKKATTKNKKANTGKKGVRREGWNSKKLGEESSYDDATEHKRRILRGDESNGNADERDVAGSSRYLEGEAGREERDLRAKNQ